MNPRARMFADMIRGFVMGIVILMILVIMLATWMSQPKPPERAPVEPPASSWSAPEQEATPEVEPPSKPRVIIQQ